MSGERISELVSIDADGYGYVNGERVSRETHQAVHALVVEAIEYRELLERLGQWDMLNCDPPCTADGPYWKREITAAIEKATGKKAFASPKDDATCPVTGWMIRARTMRQTTWSSTTRNS